MDGKEMDTDGHLRIYYPQIPDDYAKAGTFSHMVTFYDYETQSFVEQIATTIRSFNKDMRRWEMNTTVRNTLIAATDSKSNPSLLSARNKAITSENRTHVLSHGSYNDDAAGRVKPQ